MASHSHILAWGIPWTEEPSGLQSIGSQTVGHNLVKVPQSCLTLCDPMDCSPLGSSIHESFQARILEWVAIFSPGDFPNPGIKPGSPALQSDSLPSEPPGNPLESKSQSLKFWQRQREVNKN